MPITYRIDSERGIVLTAATGVLTDDEVMAHKRALAGDPGYRAGMRELSDVRGVERLDVTPEGVRLMASLDRVQVFRDIAEARAWLALPPDDGP